MNTSLSTRQNRIQDIEFGIEDCEQGIDDRQFYNRSNHMIIVVKDHRKNFDVFTKVKIKTKENDSLKKILYI